MDFGALKNIAANKAKAIADNVKNSFDIKSVLANWDEFVSSFDENKINDAISNIAKDAGEEVTYRALLLNEARKLPNLTKLQSSAIKGGLGYLICPIDFIKDSIKGIGYYDDLIVLEKSCFSVADIITDDIKSAALAELTKLIPDYDKNVINKVDASLAEDADKILKTKEAIESTKEVAVQTAKKVSDTAVATGQAINETIDDIKQTEEYQTIVATGEVIGDKTVQGAKIVSGVQAYQDRKEVQDLNKQAEEIKLAVETHTEELRVSLNNGLERLGEIRLKALHNTVGRFITCLKAINQGAKAKEYEFLKELSIDPGHIQEMEELDMKASDALKVLAVGGGFAAVGVAATPAIVTSAVTAMCAASTGTAISTLSGAAASNAVLAWLGGGSIAAGGGGMAAGSVVLGALTGGVAIGAAIVSIGILSSAFYSRKLTEATKYLAEVQEWEANIKKSWVALEAMQKRIAEIENLTLQLEKRAAAQLEQLESIIPTFDNQETSHVKTFQQAAILVKSMSELAQVSLLDDGGNLSEESNIIAAKTQKLLNSEL